MSSNGTASSLPGTLGDKEQCDYTVRAPAGGYHGAVEAYHRGQRQHIDMTISSGRGHLAPVRVFPNRQLARWDRARGTLYHITGGMCVALDDAGKEMGPARKCSGHINTEVTHEPLEAGRLGILFSTDEEKL